MKRTGDLSVIQLRALKYRLLTDDSILRFTRLERAKTLDKIAAYTARKVAQDPDFKLTGTALDTMTADQDEEVVLTPAEWTKAFLAWIEEEKEVAAQSLYDPHGGERGKPPPETPFYHLQDEHLYNQSDYPGSDHPSTLRLPKTRAPREGGQGRGRPQGGATGTSSKHCLIHGSSGHYLSDCSVLANCRDLRELLEALRKYSLCGLCCHPYKGDYLTHYKQCQESTEGQKFACKQCKKFHYRLCPDHKPPPRTPSSRRASPHRKNTGTNKSRDSS